MVYLTDPILLVDEVKFGEKMIQMDHFVEVVQAAVGGVGENQQINVHMTSFGRVEKDR